VGRQGRRFKKPFETNDYIEVKTMEGNISSWLYDLFCYGNTVQLRLQTSLFGPRLPALSKVLERQ
jgi:hypothetical protein